MNILVTGGAGYIGSHVVRRLSEAGHDVVVFDNLSTGSSRALLHNEKLIIADLQDAGAVFSAFDAHRFDAVMHFAASIVAPESVAQPLRYYRNNVVSTLNLLEACVRHGVGRFILSSTAAVYGMADSGAVSEDSPTEPINPYGASKLMCERMLADTAQVHNMQYVALRYFNVAGAEQEARLGQRGVEATHLIRVCCDAAMARRKQVLIFGTDYPTADGTGVRDYIHVEDLADSHIKALKFLENGNASVTVNVGYGRGSSVREVVDMVRSVTGVHFPTIESSRRPGDPPVLIAKADRVKTLFGWQPRFDDLRTIVEDAWRWERADKSDDNSDETLKV